MTSGQQGSVELELGLRLHHLEKTAVVKLPTSDGWLRVYEGSETGASTKMAGM